MSCEVTFFRASSQAPFALLKTEVCFVQHVHSHLFFARLKKCFDLRAKFDLDQSERKSSQVNAGARKPWPNGAASRPKFSTCVSLRLRLATALQTKSPFQIYGRTFEKPRISFRKYTGQLSAEQFLSVLSFRHDVLDFSCSPVFTRFACDMGHLVKIWIWVSSEVITICI